MRRLAVVLIAVALLLAGCGGYSNQKQQTGPGGTTTSKRVPAY
jgi:ABC-type glycerol-3-phosphate transport system substrate-binding protein